MPIDDALVRIAKGELLDSDWDRLVYSVDASHYQIKPQAIVWPADSNDVQEVCKYCSSKQLPLGPRGSGTGLLGQSLTDGIMLDFTKHMNRIVEIEENYVVTQPGIIKAVLDIELLKRGKFLPVDPASSNYCSIGGMIANNSSGIHCLGYGNMIDFLLAVDLTYADGSTGYASETAYDEKCKSFLEHISPQRNLVLNSFPKVSKNSCGYRIDAALAEARPLPHKIFAAAEGTLGIITQARLRILDLPEHRCLSVFGFANLTAAISAVPSILKFSPVALEMMDHTVVSAGKNRKDSGCLLFVEFAGSKQHAERQSDLNREKLKRESIALEHAADESSLTKIWGARKGALNNIMKLTVGSRKPIGLIEDTVVPPDLLQDHLGSILKEYSRLNLEYVMYGHVGDGNVHTRPIVDLESDSQMRIIEDVAKRVFSEVIRKGGTITGEHGDGIARLPYIRMVYREPILALFERIKEIFDSRYLLNPGKKIIAKTAS